MLVKLLYLSFKACNYAVTFSCQEEINKTQIVSRFSFPLATCLLQYILLVFFFAESNSGSFTLMFVPSTFMYVILENNEHGMSCTAEAKIVCTLHFAHVQYYFALRECHLQLTHAVPMYMRRTSSTGSICRYSYVSAARQIRLRQPRS